MSRTTLLAIGGLGIIGTGLFLAWYYQQKKAASATSTTTSTTATTTSASTPRVTGSTQRIYTATPIMVRAVTTIKQ